MKISPSSKEFNIDVKYMKFYYLGEEYYSQKLLALHHDLMFYKSLMLII